MVNTVIARSRLRKKNASLHIDLDLDRYDMYKKWSKRAFCDLSDLDLDSRYIGGI